MINFSAMTFKKMEFRFNYFLKRLLNSLIAKIQAIVPWQSANNHIGKFETHLPTWYICTQISAGNLKYKFKSTSANFSAQASSIATSLVVFPWSEGNSMERGYSILIRVYDSLNVTDTEQNLNFKKLQK